MGDAGSLDSRPRRSRRLCDRPRLGPVLAPKDDRVLALRSMSGIVEAWAWFWLTALWNSGLAVGEGEKGEPDAVRRIDWDGVGEKPRVKRDVESGEDE